jgi:transposase
MDVKTTIHSMYTSGKSFDEIAVVVNLNRKTVKNKVSRYRAKEPDKWPKQRAYPKKSDVYEVEVFECEDCCLVFAMEEDEGLGAEAACPVCWETENIKMIGKSKMKVKLSNIE